MPPTCQGLVFGVTQSLQSIALILAPLLAGGLIHVGWLAAWALCCAGALLPFLAHLPSVAPQSRIEERVEKAEAKDGAAREPKGDIKGRRTVWNLDGGVFFSTDGHAHCDNTGSLIVAGALLTTDNAAVAPAACA